MGGVPRVGISRPTAHRTDWCRLAEQFNLELEYRKTFRDVWRDLKDDPVLGPLSCRMGVRDQNSGALLVTDEEMEAASFYHAFSFVKV